MAPAILASLEQEHPPAARYPLQHEYDRAHGPRGYNPYLVIPKNERDRLMMQSVEDGQVYLAKYGQLLEDAALKHQLEHTKTKNVPLEMPQTEGDRSIDLSELQAGLRRIEERNLSVLEEAPEPPAERPGTWIEDDQPLQTTPKPADVVTESQWKPLPTPKTRKRPPKHKRKSKMEKLPEPAELRSDNWMFTFDLSTDAKKIVFGLSVMFLLGLAILILFLIGLCLWRLNACCKRICRGYKQASTDPDRVTPAEWELQELNYV